MDIRKDFNEGLGTVYERFILNDIFDKLIKKFEIKSVLEYPVFGMTGLDGINSVHLAKKNIPVTLVDTEIKRMKQIEDHWKILNLQNKLKTLVVEKDNICNLPFKPDSFDLVWNFAALWFYKNADDIINKMIDLSGNIVFISVNNKWQFGYPLRKYILDKQFFTKNKIHTKWINISNIKKIFKKRGLTIIEDGVFDTPPWPDTCLPVSELKKKIGIKAKPQQDSKWIWSMMSYYCGTDKELEQKVKKYMFIENFPVWWRIKQLWSHHRYIIAKK